MSGASIFNAAPPTKPDPFRHAAARVRDEWAKVPAKYRPLVIHTAVFAVLVFCLETIANLGIFRLPLGSVEHRREFQQHQAEFQQLLVAHPVVGKTADEAMAAIGGDPIEWGGTIGWKQWEVDLVLRRGKVEGVFYHDYPFRMQPVPSTYLITHGRPYFERFPEYLGDDYEGYWDKSGSYAFRKK